MTNESGEAAREPELVIQSSDMALVNVASLAASGALDLSPRFQRRDRWDRDKQSRLIESFILNVPVPPVYLAEEERGVFAVIDGKQRLTAVADFFAGQFRLANLAFRTDLDGRRFEDLDPISVSTLSMRPLRAVMVMRQTDDWVKHEVFLRLNTGGQPLNAQEIRNVAYAGRLNDEIIRLSSNEFLHRQLKIRSSESPAFRDMTDVELVVRFFALSETWSTFGGDMRRALDDFMAQNHRADGSSIRTLAHRFDRALHWCESIWGAHSFQRFDGRLWRDQLIGGVYDAQMVSVDTLPDDLLSAVVHRRSEAEAGMMELFALPEFDSAVRLSTNTPARVRYRVDAVLQMLRALG